MWLFLVVLHHLCKFQQILRSDFFTMILERVQMFLPQERSQLGILLKFNRIFLTKSRSGTVPFRREFFLCHLAGSCSFWAVFQKRHNYFFLKLGMWLIELHHLCKFQQVPCIFFHYGDNETAHDCSWTAYSLSYTFVCFLNTDHILSPATWDILLVQIVSLCLS